MPRFNEREKEVIRQGLLSEGERLFSAYGLKRVTIDDIVQAVNIAKASFYRFYEGKEYLFLDIAKRQQKEIFDILEEILKRSKGRTDKERVKEVFFAMSELMLKYPFLTGIDEEAVMLIARKVSQSALDEYARQGFDAVKTLEHNGIRFKYETQIVSQLFHALHETWLRLQSKPTEMQKEIIDIMLEGILQQIL